MLATFTHCQIYFFPWRHHMCMHEYLYYNTMSLQVYPFRIVNRFSRIKTKQNNTSADVSYQDFRWNSVKCLPLKGDVIRSADISMLLKPSSSPCEIKLQIRLVRDVICICFRNSSIGIHRQLRISRSHGLMSKVKGCRRHTTYRSERPNDPG